jgi:hypothetical protein
VFSQGEHQGVRYVAHVESTTGYVVVRFRPTFPTWRRGRHLPVLRFNPAITSVYAQLEAVHDYCRELREEVGAPASAVARRRWPASW